MIARGEGSFLIDDAASHNPSDQQADWSPLVEGSFLIDDAANHNPSDLSSTSLRDLDHRVLWHPFTQQAEWSALVIARGEGSFLDAANHNPSDLP